MRTTVLANLRGRVAELTDNQIGELVASPYKDIRVFAGQCLINASDLDLQDLGFELLIDEDEVVRATIIRVMGARKLNGWLKVMSRSLLDSNYVVQRAAMDALLADRKDGWGVLREHVGRYPESKISPLVKNEFLRLGIGL